MTTDTVPETPRELQVAFFELRERVEELAEEVRGLRAGRGRAATAPKRTATRDPRRDPRWLKTNVRYPGECARPGCSSPHIPAGPIAGDPIYYVPGNGEKSRMYHATCAVREGLTTAPTA